MQALSDFRSRGQEQEDGPSIYRAGHFAKWALHPSQNRAGGWVWQGLMRMPSPRVSVHHNKEAGLAPRCSFLF